MSVLFILSAIFLSLVTASYFIISMTAVTAEKVSERVSEKTDTHLRKLYVFADTRKLFLIYVLVLIGVPAMLLIAGQAVPVAMIALFAIALLPRWVMNRMALRRRKQINEALPDALAQISGSMRAGSTLTTSIQAMVEEQGGPIAQEFEHLLKEQRVGLRFDEALDNLAERVQSEEMDLVVSAAMIAQDVGGNLAETFSRLSDTIRRKIEMEGKIRALTAQGVLQGRVVSALPFMIMGALLFIEKDAMQYIYTGLLGWIFLLVIVVLQLLGGMTIRKIVNIDV